MALVAVILCAMLFATRSAAAIVRWAPALWSAVLIVLAGLWLCGRMRPAVRWISSMAVVALMNVLGWDAQYHQSAPWNTFIRGYRSMLTSRRVLVRMVPCWNEAAQLPLLLPQLPRALPGLARVQVLVVDDGSTDGTADIAHRCGADHVCRLPQHQGLGAAFRQGLAYARALRAEVLINIDADGQDDPADIPALIAPIMQGAADLVLGARDFAQMHWNPPWVRHAQRLAAFETFALSSNYSHTIETLIKVRRLRLAVQPVAVGVSTPMRPSRLIRSRAVYGGQFFISVLRGYFS